MNANTVLNYAVRFEQIVICTLLLNPFMFGNILIHCSIVNFFNENLFNKSFGLCKIPLSVYTFSYIQKKGCCFSDNSRIIKMFLGAIGTDTLNPSVPYDLVQIGLSILVISPLQRHLFLKRYLEERFWSQLQYQLYSILKIYVLFPIYLHKYRESRQFFSGDLKGMRRVRLEALWFNAEILSLVEVSI